MIRKNMVSNTVSFINILEFKKKGKSLSWSSTTHVVKFMRAIYGNNLIICH